MPSPGAVPRARLLGAALLLVSACAGAIGDVGADEEAPVPPASPGGAPTAGVSAPPPAQPGRVAVGRTPLRRLTKLEYANTVRDLFGDPASAQVVAAFAADVYGPHGYKTGGSVGDLETTQYMEAAVKLATAAVRDPAALGCAEERCLDAFLRAFGKRAYRRPLADVELADLRAVYQASRRDGFDFRRSLQTVIAAMLQSPNFLYRIERGLRDRAQDGVAPLDPYELASRLSYFLWQSMPDDRLFEAADRGALHRPEVLREQALRMLEDPRARDALASFGADWLHLGVQDITKSRSRYPKFTDAVKASMDVETTTFVANQVLVEDADLGSLFSARHTWVDAALAGAYGFPAVASGGWEKRAFPEASLRSGLLTHISLMARNAGYAVTSPTRRGVLLREQLLCQPVPPAPPDLNPTPPEPKADMTVREQMEKHVTDPSCAGCHAFFDPLGFVFETFDPIGLERTRELGGKPVDPAIELTGTDVDGRVANARELGARLARSDRARRCVAQQMFRFGLGRDEGEDPQSFEQAYGLAQKSGYRLQELMVALATSPAFLYTAVD